MTMMPLAPSTGVTLHVLQQIHGKVHCQTGVCPLVTDSGCWAIEVARREGHMYRWVLNMLQWIEGWDFRPGW